MTSNDPLDQRGQFTPADFWMVLRHLPESCPLIGGQAVAWWAMRYGELPQGEPVTSEDIDFWGARDDVKHVARALNLTPIFPNEYEMTVWSGGIQLEIEGKRSLADFLHTVPGLEVLSVEKASTEEHYASRDVNRTIRVLTPVSLIMAKLHCLRHFKQEDRNDELHLRVCLKTARRFLAEALLQRNLRHVFWNIERLVAAHKLKAYRRLEKELGFNILDAVPIEDMNAAAEETVLPPGDRERLTRFLGTRWVQLLADTSESSED
jgi:hypothetical protein